MYQVYDMHRKCSVEGCEHMPLMGLPVCFKHLPPGVTTTSISENVLYVEIVEAQNEVS
jgi:hypothetical protein